MFRKKQESLDAFACIYYSKPYQHRFNVPAQLICWPDEVKISQMNAIQRRKIVKMIENCDRAKMTSGLDAVQVSFPVKEGDVIIAGSDGLFDNVW